MTRALGMEVPISMASASRLPSSMTVRARKGRPSYRASTIKSRAHVSFRRAGATSGCRRRAGTRRFIRRSKFRRSAQYTIETLPEPPATMASHDGVQRGDHVAIPPQPRPRRPVVRRPRQPHGLAGAPHRDPVLLHQHRQDFPFRGRRHRFRLRTSLIAAFSRARSAYIRLSLAFSASSSFSRFSSATEAPAYFARHWKYVALLMLCWRKISAIGTPASPCFRISTIWLSVNRDFRMGISLAPESLPSHGLPDGEAYGST